MPLPRARRASVEATRLPLGTESRTIVQPPWPAGHFVSWFAGGGGGGGGGAAAVVVGVLSVVGSGAVCVVSCTLEAAGEVSTSVPPLASERSVNQSAEAVPATAAITSASSAGQIQSPGYQPSRLRQNLPSAVTSPLLARSRAPHSRQ